MGEDMELDLCLEVFKRMKVQSRAEAEQDDAPLLWHPTSGIEPQEGSFFYWDEKRWILLCQKEAVVVPKPPVVLVC